MCSALSKGGSLCQPLTDVDKIATRSGLSVDNRLGLSIVAQPYLWV
ncbi:hypothetical protein EVA_05026 [gut metagenome]|uniref:Uncharacterized protein n=1 Tax=gut metagenome TaxID=749906 RepID=J9GIB0_9ZZZZ